MPFYQLSTSGGLVEAATYAALPATGVAGTLYVVTATNTLYRWSGSAYVEVSASPAEIVEGANLAAFPATGAAGKLYVALDTGKAYRWSGSAYVEVSGSDWSTIANKPSTFAPSAHAASHASGGSDAVTVAVSQVTGLQSALDGKAASTHEHSAEDITGGTIDAARLPAGVALVDANGLCNIDANVQIGGDAFVSGNLQADSDIACAGDVNVSGYVFAKKVGINTIAPLADIQVVAGYEYNPATQSYPPTGNALYGAQQTENFQVIHGGWVYDSQEDSISQSDYINLARFHVNAAHARGCISLSNSGTGGYQSGQWQQNVLQFFVHGSGYSPGYYGGNECDAGCAMIVTQGSDIQKLQIGNYGAAPIEFFASNAMRMRIEADGNVGIGVASPQARLDVDGGIKLTGALQSAGEMLYLWSSFR